MTTTLRDFMDARETAIKEQIKALRGELAEIKVARQALASGSGEVSTSPSASSLTIKDMVRAVLEGAPRGMTAHDILSAIRSDFGKELERTSLSPQLSRLKGDKEVWLEGDTWFLMSHWLTFRSKSEDGDNPVQSYDEGDDHNSAPY